MSVSRLLLIVLTAALLPLSGCFGDGADQDDEETQEEETSVPVLAPAAPPAVHFAAGSCRQAALLAPVENGQVEAHLPDGYRVYRDDAGVAWFGVSFTHCPSYIKDGGHVQAAVNIAEAGIIIESPDGTGGIHVYQLVGTTDADRLGRDLGRLGITGGHLEKTAYAADDLLPVGGHNGDAPWPGLGVAFEATAASALAPTPGIERITWWHESTNATVRLTYGYSALSAAPAQGVLHVEEGSPFHDILGTTSVDTGGFLFAHRFDATAEHHVPEA